MVAIMTSPLIFTHHMRMVLRMTVLLTEKTCCEFSPLKGQLLQRSLLSIHLCLYYQVEMLRTIISRLETLSSSFVFPLPVSYFHMCQSQLYIMVWKNEHFLTPQSMYIPTNCHIDTRATYVHHSPFCISLSKWYCFIILFETCCRQLSW